MRWRDRPEVDRYEADEVGERELDVVTAIDRRVRGSARTVDVVAMLGQPGNHLLLHEDQAYAVAKDERIVTLGACQEDSAALVLRAMLAEAPAGETIEVNWLTSAQQWAVREVVAAGHRAPALRAGHGARHGRAAQSLHSERRDSVEGHPVLTCTNLLSRSPPPTDEGPR